MKRNRQCGWRTPGSNLGSRSFGVFGKSWRRGMPRMKDENTNGVSSYLDHVANAASFEAFRRHEENPLLSAEALPESSSLIDFKTFACEYPDKLFPLLEKLRPEFREYFVEYYLLGKSQSWIGQTHGCIQTRIWQALRIIEQTIGALIILGPEPDETVLRPLIEKAGLESTPYGSLTTMICLYASSHNYAVVAKSAGAPVPAIRKIFRPSIAALLKSKNVRTIAVGAYLRNLTHQASLTSAGLSKRSIARTRRVKNLRFDAPPSENAPLLSFGTVRMLRDTPWCMLEISSEHRMEQIYPALKKTGKQIFKKRPAQIFAPVTAEGDLAFGYIFARSTSPSVVRALTRIRGISEFVTIHNDDGNFVRAMTVPHADIQGMMSQHSVPEPPDVRVGDFVEILTGPAANYFGIVTKENAHTHALTLEVRFPTGRCFTVTADATCVRPIPNIAESQRTFWGVRQT